MIAVFNLLYNRTGASTVEYYVFVDEVQ